MSSTPLPLDVIADPVRRRIVERLDGGATATVEELTTAAGVHVNTVRTHLAALEAAGVLVRGRAATGARGRPPLTYRLADGWRLPTDDFKGLADLLAAGVAALDPSPEQLDELGRGWGRALAAGPDRRPARELIGPAMDALGFHAALDGDVVTLSGCPCRLVLPDRPELVCRLAVAVVDGLAAASGDRLRVRASTHDPATRTCELRLGRRRRAALGRAATLGWR